jgi:hypothetical protein
MATISAKTRQTTRAIQMPVELDSSDPLQRSVVMMVNKNNILYFF